MKRQITVFLFLFHLLPTAAFAHRLDGYLEATILSFDHDTVRGTMRLVPGVSVSSSVLGMIDTNSDGLLSPSEQQAYTHRVLADVLLTLDDRPLPLHLVSATFAAVASLRQGSGEILIDFEAPLRPGRDERTLRFENKHQPAIAVYLVNCLDPEGSQFHIVAQSRNQNESSYQLTFTQAASAFAFGAHVDQGAFAPAFRLGVRHIAKGTDHLLFLLTMLLPAPLLVYGSRWAGPATVRISLRRIFGIVTAFTLGHSLTLALAAFGVFRLPERPVEVLIAVSILISALHALSPLFPGREASVAAFFGLIHGLAFASALSDLGFASWYRILSLLGFNFGIEAMQIVVVAAVLPSLLLLSRTPAYPWFRIGGGFLAVVASTGWIVERLLTASSLIDPIAAGITSHALAGAALLLLVSLLCWYGRSKSSVYQDRPRRLSSRSMLSHQLADSSAFAENADSTSI